MNQSAAKSNSRASQSALHNQPETNWSIESEGDVTVAGKNSPRGKKPGADAHSGAQTTTGKDPQDAKLPFYDNNLCLPRTRTWSTLTSIDSVSKEQIVLAFTLWEQPVWSHSRRGPTSYQFYCCCRCFLIAIGDFHRYRINNLGWEEEDLKTGIIWEPLQHCKFLSFFQKDKTSTLQILAAGFASAWCSKPDRQQEATSSN